MGEALPQAVFDGDLDGFFVDLRKTVEHLMVHHRYSRVKLSINEGDIRTEVKFESQRLRRKDRQHVPAK